MTETGPYVHSAALRQLAARLLEIAVLPEPAAAVAMTELVDRSAPCSAEHQILQARRDAARLAKLAAGSGVRLARQLGVSEMAVSRMTRL